MQRLSGLDANFLYNETPTEHMHTLKLAVLDPPEGKQLPWDLVRHEVGRRMAHWPAFARKVVAVPGDLNHPVWVEAGEPDLGYHVRRARIPDPGTPHEMDLVVARLAGWPLDRQHPLWQVWLLEGRADGRMAVLVKVHHCVADGIAANALLASIMSTDPHAGLPAETPTRGNERGEEPLGSERDPGSRELLAHAAKDLVFDALRVPATALGLRDSVRKRRRAMEELEAGGGEMPPRPILDTPKTSFNRAITAARSVSTSTLALAPMLDVKKRSGVTLNDVLLTIVGGALMEVLADNGERPTMSLTASVPVSSEPPPEPGQPPRRSGNKVSNLFVSLHTEIVDPLERLEAVHGSMVGAKSLHDATGSDLMETMLGYTPPRPYAWAMQRYSGLDVADLHRAPVNVIVSNVPGPREPLWVAGARLVEFFSAGPVLEGIALNVTAWSYIDAMDLMVTACARALPEPSRVSEGMAHQLDLLTDA